MESKEKEAIGMESNLSVRITIESGLRIGSLFRNLGVNQPGELVKGRKSTQAFIQAVSAGFAK